jgi:transcriptional regulator with XRE-family HTH domain
LSTPNFKKFPFLVDKVNRLRYYIIKEVKQVQDRIKQVRQSEGLTQAEFAEKIGLSRNYIAMIEIGQREPSDRTIKDICRIFGVNEIWLRTGVGEPFTPLSRSEELAAIFERMEVGDDAKSRLIRAMARMPDEAFPPFVKFVEQLYKNFTEE